MGKYNVGGEFWLEERGRKEEHIIRVRRNIETCNSEIDKIEDRKEILTTNNYWVRQMVKIETELKEYHKELEKYDREYQYFLKHSNSITYGK